MTTELEQELLILLQTHPQGMSEFELLRHLQRSEQQAFEETLCKDNLAMYRAHFQLFHALYRLQERPVSEQRAHLEIHVLAIRLHPWHEAGSGDLATTDPMRAYYVDLANMEDTRAEDVEQLLGEFWSQYFANERRGAAR